MRPARRRPVTSSSTTRCRAAANCARLERISTGVMSRALGLLEMVHARTAASAVLRQRRGESRTWLCMSQKIDQDHSRFRQIVRGKIKQNLRKYISQGEMIGTQGQGPRLDPASRRSTSRTSASATSSRAASGRATASRAIRSGRASEQAGDGQGKAGEGAGEHAARGRRHARRARRDPRRGARAAATSSTRARARSSTRKDQATPASAASGPSRCATSSAPTARR